MSDLPFSWAETTLGEIASQGQYGWTTKAAEHGRVKYLRTTDITSGHINWDTVPYCQDTPPIVEKYKVKLGDILISRAGSVGFSVLIQDVPSTPAVFASYLIRYNPSPEVNAKFIARFLQSQNYWQQISDASAGIALANVNAKKLANVVLPIAPLNEQNRIAEKLDSLLARVDSCQSHLEHFPQILKRFRQSVLGIDRLVYSLDGLNIGQIPVGKRSSALRKAHLPQVAENYIPPPMDAVMKLFM